MIVKLKCVDTCECDYFTTGETYNVFDTLSDDCYWILNDDGDE